jgi:type VI secretion system protein ImpL
MKIEQTNPLVEAVAPTPEAKPIAVWGLALLAIILAALALAVVWVKGDLVYIQGIEEKKTASLWILGVLVAIFMLCHLSA